MTGYPPASPLMDAADWSGQMEASAVQGVLPNNLLNADFLVQTSRLNKNTAAEEAAVFRMREECVSIEECCNASRD